MKSLSRSIFALLLVALLVPPAFACCDDLVVVDATDAYERSQREERDPIEGFWATHIIWHPEPDAARSYRLAIVKNIYDVYPEAEYIGVATCEQSGCIKGEVKLLLHSTHRKNEYETVMLTNKGLGRGKAILTRDPEDNRPNSVIDMRNVKFNEHVMTKWLVRVMDS